MRSHPPHGDSNERQAARANSMTVKYLLCGATAAAVLIVSSALVSGQDRATEDLTVLSDLAGLGRSEDSVSYFKASNAAAYERFGESIALSADGGTLAVSAMCSSVMVRARECAMSVPGRRSSK